MTNMIERKSGQLWSVPKSSNEEDDSELYLLVKPTDSWPMRSWEVLRFRNKYQDRMFSLWTEDVMKEDVLVLDAK